MASRKESPQAVRDMVYLASCAVRNTEPDLERVRQMDLSLVYHEAKRQLLAGCCAFALELVGMCSEDFAQAKAETIRRVILMDVQCKEVLDSLEEAGIWYLPLKGAVLKDYYPSIGMREMSDIDILYDASRTKDMRDIMVNLGFSGELGDGAHDCFYKEPIYNFEMHHVLFSGSFAENQRVYYDVAGLNKLLDDGKCFGYHFTPEDLYIYIIAHAYKHYCYSGLGLRGCLDLYVYLTRTSLDMEYIIQESERMGISGFEEAFRNLSLHLVNGSELSDSDRKLLNYMHVSGAYGNLDSSVKHRIAERGGGVRGRMLYIYRRIIPPRELIKDWYPLIYRHKILLPLIPLIRLGKALTTGRAKAIRELKATLFE